MTTSTREPDPSSGRQSAGPPLSGRRPYGRRARPARVLAVAVAGTIVAGGAAVAGAGPALAAPAPSRSLVRSYQDGYLLWTVPVGTYSVTISAVGGAGGEGSLGGGITLGGEGGRGDVVVEAAVPVRPGQVLGLYPGGAGHGISPGRSTWNSYFATQFPLYSGGMGGHSPDYLTDVNAGGGGGAASMVASDSGTPYVVAGGGGGGGGGGVISPYFGGRGGDAQHNGTSGDGLGAGAGGAGSRIGGPEVSAGGVGDTTPSWTSAGAGGGGGGGWDGATMGGGNGGSGGVAGGGGGGGGAGGRSFASEAKSAIATSGSVGDGWVRLDWRPGVNVTTTIGATPSVPQGRPIDLALTITSTDPSLAAWSNPVLPSGPVTFEEVDPYTGARTVLASATAVDGRATVSLPTAGLSRGTHAIRALYAGDDTFYPATSGYVYPVVTAPVTTVSLDPSTLAFGNRAVGALVSQSVTVTNTGSIAWRPTVAATSDGDVNLPATDCWAGLAPGQSCGLTISFQPHAAGSVSAAITLSTNFGTLVVPVTGTGVAAPAVTAITPASGPSAGGTRVTVTGRDFVDVRGITVGGTPMSEVSCPSTTTCTALTPAGTSRRHIQVSAIGGASAAVAADRFRYTG